MGQIKLRSPLLRKHLWDAHTCMINQLFGENRNALFYGPQGHTAIDIATIGEYAYLPHYQTFENGKRKGEWKREERSTQEKLGRIHLVAAHDGFLTTNVFWQDERNGWGMILTSEDGSYRTLYWHIESPWKSLQVFTERIAIQFSPKWVRQGTIIAIAGNSGHPKYSTGPHLHFELQRKVNGVWTPEDPMPHFEDNETIYHRWFGGEYHKHYFQGKEITKAEAQKLRDSWPKIIV